MTEYLLEKLLYINCGRKFDLDCLVDGYSRSRSFHLVTMQTSVMGPEIVRVPLGDASNNYAIAYSEGFYFLDRDQFMRLLPVLMFAILSSSTSREETASELIDCLIVKLRNFIRKDPDSLERHLDSSELALLRRFCKWLAHSSKWACETKADITEILYCLRHK